MLSVNYTYVACACTCRIWSVCVVVMCVYVSCVGGVYDVQTLSG